MPDPPPSKYPICDREFELTDKVDELSKEVWNRTHGWRRYPSLEDILGHTHILDFINNKIPGTSYTFLHKAFLYDEDIDYFWPDILDVVKKLIEAGANPNIQDEKTGDTPLHLAVKNLRYRKDLKAYIEFLMSRDDWDPNLKNNKKKTAYDLAKHTISREKEILDLLNPNSTQPNSTQGGAKKNK